MARILITDGMDKQATEILRKMGHEIEQQFYESTQLNEKLKQVDVVIIRSATKIRIEQIDAARETGQLKMIIRAGVGIDNIDASYAETVGIAVRNTPNASSASVAELAIAHMFALARFLYISNVSMRCMKWEKKAYKGIELNGKTLGLVGFGRIAKETAKRAKALGMNIVYTNRSGRKDGYDQYRYVDMDELLKVSDFISLHTPFNKDAGPLITSAEFQKMKKGVFLVNCSRGGVVNEADLIKALNSGQVEAAAVDVFIKEPIRNEELCTHPKVSLTPHIGASTKEAQARIGEEIIGILKENFEYRVYET